MKWAGHEARVSYSRAGELKGKKSLGTPKSIRKGNIKTGLTEGW